jgi:hypothetical protein
MDKMVNNSEMTEDQQNPDLDAIQFQKVQFILTSGIYLLERPFLRS